MMISDSGTGFMNIFHMLASYCQREVCCKAKTLSCTSTLRVTSVQKQLNDFCWTFNEIVTRPSYCSLPLRIFLDGEYNNLL